MTTAKHIIGSFGRFWWEFLIGESPDAFIGTLVIVGVALLLHREEAAVIIVVPLLAAFCLVLSAFRGRRRA